MELNTFLSHAVTSLHPAFTASSPSDLISFSHAYIGYSPIPHNSTGGLTSGGDISGSSDIEDVLYGGLNTAGEEELISIGSIGSLIAEESMYDYIHEVYLNLPPPRVDM